MFSNRFFVRPKKDNLGAYFKEFYSKRAQAYGFIKLFAKNRSLFRIINDLY